MNTATTAPRTCSYFVGQRVEVETVDFKAAGMPKFYLGATVTEVTDVDGKHWDVMATDDEGSVRMTRVGTRGGGRKVRAL